MVRCAAADKRPGDEIGPVASHVTDARDAGASPVRGAGTSV